LLSTHIRHRYQSNNKGKPLPRPTHFLKKVGMDIGYGHPDSPDGFVYSLLIVDYKNRNKYIYVLRGITGAEIHNALLAFFVEAEGIPGTIRCDFDTKFIDGSAHQLLLVRGIGLQTPPPWRSSLAKRPRRMPLETNHMYGPHPRQPRHAEMTMVVCTPSCSPNILRAQLY
jgi:hypothetical protein